jgi:ubiquinone/menaquinone biosynthesis C-methylase UbiE
VVLALGAAQLDEALRLAPVDGDVVLVDASAETLEALVARVADARVAFLLGELPVLPLPDASVDVALGAAEEDGEVQRVLRPADAGAAAT